MTLFFNVFESVTILVGFIFKTVLDEKKTTAL